MPTNFSQNGSQVTPTGGGFASTTLARVKAAMDSQETYKDTDLQEYLTRASRLIDRLCTGIPSAYQYFYQEDVVNEVLTNGVISNGVMTFWPHKPVINSVASLSWRYKLSDPWIAVTDLSPVIIMNEQVRYEAWALYASEFYIQVSYNGGLANNVDLLPYDFVDAATLLAVRLYKEARSGVGDAIGVAELGTLMYTKAFPQRVLNTLKFYERMAPWT